MIFYFLPMRSGLHFTNTNMGKQCQQTRRARFNLTLLTTISVAHPNSSALKIRRQTTIDPRFLISMLSSSLSLSISSYYSTHHIPSFHSQKNSCKDLTASLSLEKWGVPSLALFRVISQLNSVTYIRGSKLFSEYIFYVSVTYISRAHYSPERPKRFCLTIKDD